MESKNIQTIKFFFPISNFKFKLPYLSFLIIKSISKNMGFYNLPPLNKFRPEISNHVN